MRSIAVVMMLGAAGASQADPSFSLDPALAQEGQIVNLRVDDPELCTRFGFPTVRREGSVVTASFVIDDASVPGQCIPGYVAPRKHSLGTFASGVYQVNVEYCAAPPLPCTTPFTLPLAVFGVSGTRVTVPTLAGPVAMLLVFGVVVLAAVRRR